MKGVFKVKEVTYIGHIPTQEGVNSDDENIRVVNDMPAATDKKGVERFHGTVNYLSNLVDNN